MIAINLDPGDSCGWVRKTSGNDDIILVSREGKALRFSEDQVRVTGRMTMGVMGIRLRGDDYVIGMEVVEEGSTLLVLTEKGQGKRTQMEEYIPKNRGTLGVTTFVNLEQEHIGKLQEACTVQEDDEITLITRGGIVMRTKVAAISIQGRATQGVRVIDIDEGDSLAAMTRICATESFPHRDKTSDTKPNDKSNSENDLATASENDKMNVIIIDDDDEDEMDEDLEE